MEFCNLLYLLVPAAAVALSFLYLCWNSSRGNPKTLPFPPGPAPLPFVGNLLDIPVYNQWLTFAQWGQKYGDIMHVSALGSHTIILNSINVVIDLLDKRSSKYSSRPKLPMVRELAKFNKWFIAMMDNGPLWRKLRKHFHQSFNPNAIAHYEKAQIVEARNLLSQLFYSQEQFRDHIHLWAAAVIMRLIYGIEVHNFQNEYVRLAHKTVYMLSKVVIPGRYLVDALPILKHYPSWLPGGGFQNEALDMGISARDSTLIPFEGVKQAMVDEKTRVLPLVVSASLDALKNYDSLSGEQHEQEEIVAKIAAANAYTGALDSTLSSLTSFVLAMALHPDVQRTAQAEIDAVIGRDRLPSFSDRLNLPYMEILLKEVTRWNPFAPLGGPRRVEEDDKYNGYYIPKGSTVLVNSWAILHDENSFREPSAFKPERFWKDGKLDQGLCSLADIAFGVGRRICPGRFAVAQSLFITIASILACFEIVPAVKDDGHQIPIEAKMTPLPASHPEDFRCLFKPHHESVPELIQRSPEE